MTRNPTPHVIISNTLTTLRNYLAHKNFPPKANPLSLTVEEPGNGEVNVTLGKGEHHERYTLTVQDGRPILQGRGGGIVVSEDPKSGQCSGLHQLVATVNDGAGSSAPSTGESDLNLSVLLKERGFEVRWGKQSEMFAGPVLTPVIATHPDGTVAWFEHAFNPYFSTIVVSHGLVRLGLYINAEDPAVPYRPGKLSPVKVTPVSWYVSGEALDAALASLRTDQRRVLTPQDVPLCVPEDFQARQNEYAMPE